MHLKAFVRRCCFKQSRFLLRRPIVRGGRHICHTIVEDMVRVEQYDTCPRVLSPTGINTLSRWASTQTMEKDPGWVGSLPSSMCLHRSYQYRTPAASLVLLPSWPCYCCRCQMSSSVSLFGNVELFRFWLKPTPNVERNNFRAPQMPCTTEAR